MAYISTEEVKLVRNKLKEESPHFKFSVVRDNYSSVNISIVEGPVEFEKTYEQINHYYPDRYQQGELFKRIYQIAITEPSKITGREWRNNSDAMTDYFDISYYVSINVGKWDKPYCYKGGNA